METKEINNETTFKPFDETKQITTNKSDVWIIFGILCTIFILISIIIFCTFSLATIQSTTIAKGVYIKGIDVYGLTK